MSRIAPCCCCLGGGDAIVGKVMAETTVGVGMVDGSVVVGVATDGDRKADEGRVGWACPTFHCGGNVERRSGVWCRRKGMISLRVLVG